jgi:RimJ/RimL family protein N-acetyltransferase
VDHLRGTDKLGGTFHTRPQTAADHHALYRMYLSFEPKRVAQGLPPAHPDQIRRWLDRILAEGYHLVVEVGGALVGHGMLLPYRPGSAELANFLHQSVRERGIGTALNAALLELGRQQGLRSVWLSVEPVNRRAIRSYEKVGFRRRSTSILSPELEMEIDLV